MYTMWMKIMGVLIGFLAFPQKSLSVSIIVVPQDAATIQAAVDRAQPRDVIVVRPGLYKESVTISKNYLTLIADVPPNGSALPIGERVVLDGEERLARGI